DHADPSLLPALQSVAGVKAVQYVSLFSACWQPAPTGCGVSLDIVSSPDLDRIPITPFQLSAGRYPDVGEIVVEQGDQSLHGASIGDVITLHAGDRMAQARVVGFARTPGVDPRATGTALAYRSDAALQQLATAVCTPTAIRPDGQLVPVFQHHLQVQFQSANPQLESAVVAALQQLVQAHGIDVLGSGFAPKVEASTLGTIDGVFSLLRTLALVAVVLSTLLILNTLTTLVPVQTALLCTLKALCPTRAA